MEYQTSFLKKVVDIVEKDGKILKLRLNFK